MSILSSGDNLDVNEQFQHACDTIENTSHHVLISGKAGTGKSTLLNYIRMQTTKKAITLSPTGLAAVQINGQTIHSFFGFPPNITVEKARKEGSKKSRSKIFKELELLIIDEVSMVRADILDCIDQFLRIARGSTLPFGKVQLVLIGDLYQLPPVIRSQDKDIFSQVYRTPYFFSSFGFKEILQEYSDMFTSITLEKVYRQNDGDFVNALNAIRFDQGSEQAIQLLNQRVVNKDTIKEGIILTTTNKKSDTINWDHLDLLPFDGMEYEAEIDGDFDKSSYPTTDLLYLKKGARVMFVKNDTAKRFQNGTLGTVLKTLSQSVKVQIDNGPIITVDPIRWDNHVTVFNDDTNQLEQEVSGSFVQIPLKLAWAITIHKSQGQTFDSMVLDLESGAFTTGQTYVALSRCRSLEGLQLVKPLTLRDIRTDSTIHSFFAYLNSMGFDSKPPHNSD